MRKLVIAAAALAFTGTAQAADMPMLKAPPMAVAAPNWTGLYIGVNGGWASGVTDTGTSEVRLDNGRAHLAVEDG